MPSWSPTCSAGGDAVKWVLGTVLVLGLGMIASGAAMLATAIRDFDEGMC